VVKHFLVFILQNWVAWCVRISNFTVLNCTLTKLLNT